jgi:glycosyltransferase A (GT-A) superfamily protein (DUF2064 family)
VDTAPVEFSTFKSTTTRDTSMTVVALLAKPPRPGIALPDLAESTALTPAEAAELYAAMLEDAIRTVLESGGELVVTYRTAETLPEHHEAEESAETQLREVASNATDAVDALRFEPQVGSTQSARVGNTVTHLLETEGATSAAVLRPEAPLLERTHVDSMAMKLRTNEVVLGPTTRGRVYAAGFASTIDFADALDSRPLETLAKRGEETGHSVEFQPMLPLVETDRDLATLHAMLQARSHAGRPVPAATTAMLERLDVGNTNAR